MFVFVARTVGQPLFGSDQTSPTHDKLFDKHSPRLNLLRFGKITLQIQCIFVSDERVRPEFQTDYFQACQT